MSNLNGSEIPKTDEVVNALKRIKEIGEKLQDETPSSYTDAMAKRLSQITGMEVGIR
jgi:ribosomal protein S13